MAHGLPAIIICLTCEHYALIGRFSPEPICSVCGNRTVRMSKDKIVEKYNLHPLKFKSPYFDKWTKITDTKLIIS